MGMTWNLYVIKNAWPDEWTDRYREQRYFLKDPVSQWSLKRSKPFFWAEARAASISTAQATKIENEARAFGLGEGVAFPMYDASSWQAVISLATSDKCDLDKSSIANLYLLSLYCKMTACDLLPGWTDRRAVLSAREQEILQWVSVGKSSWDVSRILQYLGRDGHPASRQNSREDGREQHDARGRNRYPEPGNPPVTVPSI